MQVEGLRVQIEAELSRIIGPLLQTSSEGVKGARDLHKHRPYVKYHDDDRAVWAYLVKHSKAFKVSCVPADERACIIMDHQLRLLACPLPCALQRLSRHYLWQVQGCVFLYSFLIVTSPVNQRERVGWDGRIWGGACTHAVRFPPAVN